MDDGFIVLGASGPKDSAGVKLRGTLEAHFAYERARGLRGLVVSILATLGVPVWLSAACPQWIPVSLRTLALTAWAVCTVALVLAAIAEWRCWHRLAEVTEDAARSLPRVGERHSSDNAPPCIEPRGKAI